MPEREERPDKKNLPGSRMSEKNAPLGVGGTITTLALLCEGATSFSEWRGEKEIPLLELCTTLQALSQMGDEARASIPLLKDRHDVILQGGVILLYLMELLHTTRIDATLSDGLDGYAMHLYHTLLHD
jgi:exopolyphosphatase/pppGpp-phosphohydrolase